MVTKLRKKGDLAEEKVVKFLKRRGFIILERNYQNFFGEIDIICKRSGKLHFVEVKSSYTNFEAECNMTKRKMERITKTAMFYMFTHSIKDLDFYFDLVSVNFKKKMISMYPNINTNFN